MRIPFRQGETILHFAARRNWTTLCRWLLRLGADVDQSDILGRTALHHAARDDAPDAARLLIAHGADLDAKDWKGRTPLDLVGTGNSTAKMIREEISLRGSQRLKGIWLQRQRQQQD